jgi:hypothetical protein
MGKTLMGQCNKDDPERKFLPRLPLIFSDIDLSSNFNGKSNDNFQLKVQHNTQKASIACIFQKEEKAIHCQFINTNKWKKIN